MRRTEQPEGAHGRAKEFVIGEKFNPYKLFNGLFVPEAVCKYRGLSLGAKMTYGRLCRYAGKDGAVYPSVPTIGRELGIGQTQSRTYLRELEAKRFIQVDRVHRHYTKRGSGGSCSYWFLWHAAFDGDLGEVRKAPPVQPRGAPVRKTASAPVPVRETVPVPVRETVPVPVRKAVPLPPPVNRTQRESSERERARSESLQDVRSAARDSHEAARVFFPIKRTEADDRAVEDLLDKRVPMDQASFCGGPLTTHTPPWLTRRILTIAPNTEVREILQFLKDKIESGWRPQNWQGYWTAVYEQFAPPLPWTESDREHLKKAITLYDEGRESVREFLEEG